LQQTMAIQNRRKPMKKLRVKISVILTAALVAVSIPMAVFGESYTLNEDAEDIYNVVIGNDYIIPADENDILLMCFYGDAQMEDVTVIKSVESSDPEYAVATFSENDEIADVGDVYVSIEEGFTGAEITVTDEDGKISVVSLVSEEYSDDDEYYDEDELETPELYAKAVGSTKVRLSWIADENADGYKIYRSTKKSGSYKLIKTIKNNSTEKFTNTKLTTGKKYYYKIRSYRTVSGKTEYSSYSSIKSAKPKKNVLWLYESEDYNVYGGVRIEKMKVSYNSKNRLVVKVKFYNNRRFRASKFNWITLKVLDENGRNIGSQKFKNVKLGIKPYGTKWVTFTYSAKATKQKKAYLGGMDPDEADYYYDYYYTYTF